MTEYFGLCIDTSSNACEHALCKLMCVRAYVFSLPASLVCSQWLMVGDDGCQPLCNLTATRHPKFRLGRWFALAYKIIKVFKSHHDPTATSSRLIQRTLQTVNPSKAG